MKEDGRDCLDKSKLLPGQLRERAAQLLRNEFGEHYRLSSLDEWAFHGRHEINGFDRQMSDATYFMFLRCGAVETLNIVKSNDTPQIEKVKKAIFQLDEAVAGLSEVARVSILSMEEFKVSSTLERPNGYEVLNRSALMTLSDAADAAAAEIMNSEQHGTARRRWDARAVAQAARLVWQRQMGTAPYIDANKNRLRTSPFGCFLEKLFQEIELDIRVSPDLFEPDLTYLPFFERLKS